MKRLQNKVVLVTGGAQGMGAETSRLCAREGAQVIIADVADAPGQALAAELGSSASYVNLNVAKEQQWEAVVGDGLGVGHAAVDPTFAADALELPGRVGQGRQSHGER